MVVRVGQITSELNPDMISVVVTVAPRLIKVSVTSWLIVVTVTDPGNVKMTVVPTPVIVVICGGSVKVAVERMVDAAIADATTKDGC